MPNFQYQAKDYSGSPSQGVIEAENLDAAVGLLAGQGLIPLNIQENKLSIDLDKEFIRLTGQDRVKNEAMVVFCRQMGVLLFSGVPINAALQRIQETTDSKPLAAALKELIHRVNSGMTLTASMRKSPRVFSPIMISIMEAAETSGHLDKAFSQLSHYFQLESRTQKQIKTATRYPKIVMVALFGALILVNVMVIPAVSKIFANFNAQLPLPTRMLLGMSKIFQAYAPLIAILTVVSIFLIRRYISTPQGKIRWDHAKLKLPVLGDILHRIYLARFSRSLGMIIDSGVPFVEALTLAAHAMGNAYMYEKMVGMKEGITHGESLSRAAATTGLFTPLVLQMLRVAEETGRMDEMLIHVADFYEEELEYDLSRIGALLEPIILLILGVMVTILALGVFLPMWGMTQFAK